MDGPRHTLSLDKGWRFHRGDIPFPKMEGHEMTYSSAKAGKGWGAAAAEYDDSEWRELDLPHDWVVEGGFDREANVSQGYRKRGVAWYRRALQLDPADRGKHLELQFDGIATHATIWFNGVLVNRNWSGRYFDPCSSVAKIVSVVIPAKAGIHGLSTFEVNVHGFPPPRE